MTGSRGRGRRRRLREWAKDEATPSPSPVGFRRTQFEKYLRDRPGRRKAEVDGVGYGIASSAPLLVHHTPDVRLALLREFRKMGAADLFQSSLATADLWWVSGDMTNLVMGASKHYPLTVLLPADPPPTDGLVLLEHLLTDRSDVAVFQAITWTSGEKALYCFFWVLDEGGSWSLSETFKWPWGENQDTLSSLFANGFPVDQIAAFLRTLWHIADQPTFAETSETSVTRQAARRSERAEVRVAPIKTIYLRRQHSQPHATSRRSVEWQRRWIVSGHWRQQPHGPGRKERRPVWIAAHLKGPEGKPLDIRPTVRALVR